MFRRSLTALLPATMKAAVYKKVGEISLAEVPVPKPDSDQALIRITTTTICGSDIHIMKGETGAPLGRVIGHEPVGVVESLGDAVHGFKVGQRVLVPAITPCGHCPSCQENHAGQCGNLPSGGFQLGYSVDGSQAEYMVVPRAQYNMTPIPDDLTDEQVLMVPDILSTGMAGAERGVKWGDVVVVFAQGPIGLCATATARVLGASLIITVDGIDERLEKSKQMGADVTLNFKKCDVMQEIQRITGGQGADVAIECLGTQATFEQALRVVKPGGVLSSLGVYGGAINIPSGMEYLAMGMNDKTIRFSLCPGGRARMERLMKLVHSKRFDSSAMITHRFKLDELDKAYDIFGNQKEGVIKVAITP